MGNVLVRASALNAQDGAKLTALIQSSNRQSDAEGEAGAPEAATYEGHSSGIIETLENLLEEAEGQLSEARKKETSSKNNYEMLKQSLEDDIANANKDMDAAKIFGSQRGDGGNSTRRFDCHCQGAGG